MHNYVIPNGGCPWDLKQNYDSMIPCLTEETYEVIDAIQKKDITNLREELQDLFITGGIFQSACFRGWLFHI